MDASPWKDRHPGIPRDWRQIGEGGNATVWDAGGVAVKRLKATASREARARFARECSIMAPLKDRRDLRSVPTIEVRNREDADEIVMTMLQGNLEGVVDRFRCRPAKAAAALLPIVETLAILAAADPRVHHRDLKPSNLLHSGDESELYVGDFGCAFVEDEDRLTPDRRALGAWAFRPPEHSGAASRRSTRRATCSAWARSSGPWSTA